MGQAKQVKPKLGQERGRSPTKNVAEDHDNNENTSSTTSCLQSQMVIDIESEENHINNINGGEYKVESTNGPMTSTTTAIKKRGRPKLNENEKKNNNKKNKNNAQERKMKISEMAKELQVDDPFSIGKTSKPKPTQKKSKPPYIAIEGSSVSEPVSVTVINSYLDEQDNYAQRMFRKKFHDDAYTLNFPNLKKEDVSSWICVFCKCGPNHTVSENSQIYCSGDLFGPYYITIKDESKIEKDETNQIPNTSSSKVQENVSKKSSSNSNSNVLYGLTKIDDSQYEVWFHEDCILWTPNVYMIDTKIYGIEDTVRDSLEIQCTQCGLTGANICCFRRGCNKFTHYRCAIFSNWELNTSRFIQYCPMHINSLL